MKTKADSSSIIQTSDRAESTGNPPNQSFYHTLSSGSEITTDQSYPELYDNAMFGNETSITESSSNIYHDASENIKPSLEGHTSNIYDNTSIERSPSFVAEYHILEYHVLEDNSQVSVKDDSISLDTTPASSPVRKSVTIEETYSNTDVYNTLNEVNKHEYENQPEMVYMNQTEPDCVYDQTSTCRGQSNPNSIDLPESNMYDHLTNVEYSKASACGRQNVGDNMAMTDKLTYDYLSKSQ